MPSFLASSSKGIPLNHCGLADGLVVCDCTAKASHAEALENCGTFRLFAEQIGDS